VGRGLARDRSARTEEPPTLYARGARAGRSVVDDGCSIPAMSQPRISLSLVLHNHQPVGNFGFVLEDNHRLAYLPMIEALERHSGVRLGLHYTGPLLEWLRAERPQTVARLGDLVSRGQVEIVGGGHYEPVLTALPEHDRVAQLTRMAGELEAIFGRRPRGAWLAERVWEPDLPIALVDAGYEWTILDDAHFRAAAIPDDEHWGTYSTDDQGRRLTLFGTEQGLRYRIPFGAVQDVITYLREHATEDGARVGMMGDDGEKFGAWPTTWEHCWGSGRWVDRFFSALEANSDWLTMIPPSEWVDEQPPVGRVYVPTGSYAEMGEWSLPAAEGAAYSELLHRAVAERRPEARWLRGGFWRNFQVKYREINDLHKQMLRVSAAVVALPEGAPRERILDHLHQGQSNDCYWHGLFGGIYLSHMRLATLEHLIAAEDGSDRLVSRAGGRLAPVLVDDLDLDGRDEVLVRSDGQVVTISPHHGGGIGAWDVRAVRHALASVMRRRPEAYHARLVTFEQSGGPGHVAEEGEGAASIHEIVKVREPGLSRRLWYDRYERRSGLVHILARDTTPEAFSQVAFDELGDFVDGEFRVEAAAADEVRLARDGHVRMGRVDLPVRVRKSMTMGGGRRDPWLGLEVEIENRGRSSLEGLLAVEWDLNLLGGGGNPQAWYRVAGARHAFDSEGRAAGCTGLSMGNDGIGLVVRSAVEPVAEAWWSSIDTISVSEDGFERNHQGSCLLWTWPLRLEPGGGRTVRMEHRVEAARDRAEEEGL
jgi:4-alpha-glucanotransferase